MPILLLYPIWISQPSVLGFRTVMCTNMSGVIVVRSMIFERVSFPLAGCALLSGWQPFCLDTLCHCPRSHCMVGIGLELQPWDLASAMLFALGSERWRLPLGWPKTASGSNRACASSSWKSFFHCVRVRAHGLLPQSLDLVHFLVVFHSHKTPGSFSGLWLIQALLCWSFAIITGVCVLIGLGLWLSRRPWQDGTEAWRFTGILSGQGSWPCWSFRHWCCLRWSIRCRQGQMPWSAQHIDFPKPSSMVQSPTMVLPW